MDNLLRMRRADFWTSLIFFGIAAGMIGSAMTMPLKESFAGVQNTWYVSPALFPLMIAVGLLILAAILLRNAIPTGGARAALASLGRWAEADGNATTRMLAAIGIVTGYVFGLIPRVDYVIATTLFLQVFIATFYVGRPEIMRYQIATFLFVATSAFLFDLLGLYPSPGTPPRFALLQRGTLDEVRTLNMPVILNLRSRRGIEFPVVLTGLQDEVGILDVAGREHRVDSAEIADFWQGEYLLLWRPQTSEVKAFVPGMRDPDILWLRASLATIQGEPIPPMQSDLYDEALEARVKQYQRDRRLEADGLVSQQTQVAIIGELGAADTPRLTRPN